MKKFIIVFIFLIFSKFNFGQKIIFNSLSQDERKFVESVLKDTIDFNKLNENGIPINYWIEQDSSKQISKILYYNSVKSEYENVGVINFVHKRSLVYNNTNCKVDIIFDNLYKRDPKKGPFEAIDNIEVYKDSNINFKINWDQYISIKGDSVYFNKRNENGVKISDYRNDDIKVKQSGIICSCSKYHDVDIMIKNKIIHFIGLFEVQYFDIGNFIYLFSYKNCEKELRIYRITKN